MASSSLPTATRPCVAPIDQRGTPMKHASSRPGSGLIRIRLAIATACAALLATALSQPTSFATTAAVGQPKVGQCRNYTIQQAAKESNSSPVVACNRKHTAKVIGVVRVPTTIGMNQNDKLIPFAIKNCFPKLVATLGRTDRLRHLSAYDYTFFKPNAAQREAGARWIRCDVVLYGGGVLKPLPSNAKPMLPKAPLPNKVARCLTGSHQITACAYRHAFRATEVFKVASKTYPGSAALLRTARRRCPALVSTPRNWYATWAPTKASYQAGDRMIVCYSHKSN